VFIVKKDTSASPVLYTLSGIIDETVNFAQAVGEELKSMDFHCRNVERINSVGIKIWREYFDGLERSGVVKRFAELPPVLVSVTNSLSRFIPRDEIISFCVPFLCQECEKISLKTFLMSESSHIVSKCDKIPCIFCGSVTELDEVAEEYFSFLGTSVP
jgi:hypothetical protein